MATLLLIVRIAGERIALPAAEVESVVEIEALTIVPRVSSHIAGLAALRSRVLTVVDCRASLEAGRHEGDGRDAVVVVSDGHPYALLVDGVEDVVEASGEARPVRTALKGGWHRVAKGTVEVDGDLLLLLDLAALIAGPSAGASRHAA
ncbi:MAG: chemotaxis protein CheW [Allosphingosinicella sp.]